MGSKASEGKGTEKAPPREKKSQKQQQPAEIFFFFLLNLPVGSLRNPFSKSVFLSYNTLDFGQMVKFCSVLELQLFGEERKTKNYLKPCSCGKNKSVGPFLVSCFHLSRCSCELISDILHPCTSTNSNQATPLQIKGEYEKNTYSNSILKAHYCEDLRNSRMIVGVCAVPVGFKRLTSHKANLTPSICFRRSTVK
jgi:hypothetical protein